MLPFANLSNDPEQQYFADGITEDVTTDLSQLAGMLVISRNTAFTYRNKSTDTKQIGRELGVRYVLEGSVQRSGNRVRVNAQLIDAESDTHLWAERFDGDTSDLFALQDEVTRRIAIALNIELIGAEASRPAMHPDALDYILRGRSAFAKPPSRVNRSEAVKLFERALALDPASVEAQSWLAIGLAARVLDGMADAAAADMERAERLVEQVLLVTPRNPRAHYAKGHLLRAQGRPQEAIPEYETALAYNRNWVFAIFALGDCKFLTGSIEETIPLVEKAIRLSPRDPSIDIWYMVIGGVHLVQSRTDDAILWLKKARGANPAAPLTARLSGFRLRPQRRDGTRCVGARRSAAAERRRTLFQHRSLEGSPVFRGTEGPCLLRSHLFRRSAQGGCAGGMITTTASRRLAAILAADVAGYSRLMGMDEEGTHERLKAHFSSAGRSEDRGAPGPHRRRNGPHRKRSEIPRGARRRYS